MLLAGAVGLHSLEAVVLSRCRYLQCKLKWVRHHVIEGLHLVSKRLTGTVYILDFLKLRMLYGHYYNADCTIKDDTGVMFFF